MKEEMKDLTQGPLGKKILIFCFPLMVTNVLQVLFNMADIAVVGQFGGPTALGAVGSTTTLVTLYTAFLIGMGGGVNSLASRYYGAKNNKDLTETVHTSAIICLLTGIVILIFGQLSLKWILEILKTKAELLPGAFVYMRIYLFGMPAIAIYNFGNGIFSAAGDTKKPLYFLMASGVINVILNLFFVIGCNLDVAGVAIASVVSQYISAILIIIALLKSKEVYSLALSKLKITPSKTKEILGIGLPSGFQYAIFQIANLFIQAGVNSFDATVVSGNSAAANADGLVYDIMAAIYTACSSFIGQNYGAGKKDRIKKTYLISLGYSFGAGLVMGLLLVFWGRGFLGLFTNDAAVIEEGVVRLTIMGFSYCISAFMDCTIAASRGLGKSVVPTIIVIMGSCVFRIVWINTVFVYFGTIESIYLLYVCSWSLTAIVEIIYFVAVYKKTVNSINISNN